MCVDSSSCVFFSSDPVTCEGFSHGNYISDPDNCALSHRCLVISGVMEQTQPGITHCTSGQVFVVPHIACLVVDQAPCADYSLHVLSPAAVVDTVLCRH
ncbi:hypothetical protein NP493_22g06021 [Ridgeia piscesae]|uniref:Chitin-binding type-2 domain-containing protein n=1 Tax=Ridgeia piscesae TaxID=27915 RepID=A0AAD9PDV6_RIDPI|nr:hypothetical protein NP493_22g06021 [Ridgeia piscesae]